MSEFRPEEQTFNVGSANIGVVVARWNTQITDGLLSGAKQELARNNVSNFQVLTVPGAFELPLAAQKMAKTGRFDAIVCLGCVIRGGTPHFEYVCAETARGVGEVALQQNLPVGFGLLTTDDLQQAIDRSSDNEENKGVEAVAAVLEMLVVLGEIA